MQACCAFWSDLDLKGLFSYRWLCRDLCCKNCWSGTFNLAANSRTLSSVLSLSSFLPARQISSRLMYISRWSISCLMDSFFYWSEVIWVLSCSSICCVSVTRRLLTFALYIKIRDHSLLGHMVRVGLGGMVKRRKHSVVGILRKLRGMWNRNPELLVSGQTNNLVWAWLCWLWVIIKFF